jgi:aldehyde dehydrogenase
MQAATVNLIPVTLELGGKSPNIFFSDVMAQDDAFLDKAVEGFVLFAFNQGEVCTCPSRALIQEDIYEAFIERAIARVKAIKQGDPRLMDTMVGAQASQMQHDKIMSYLHIGREEGAQVLVGGDAARFNGDLAGGFYIQPTILKGHNKMRVFQEEIFGPVVSVTTFKDEAEALHIANDTMYGLGAGVWTRDGTRAYRFGRAIEAGRVWVNNYHAYPAHAAFGGYKQSGIGRETHKMMLDHYQQTKNMLVSYNPNKLGFF